MDAGRILFLFESEAPFVRADLAILGERYEVEPVNVTEGRSTLGILRRLRRADLSYSWFALGHAARAVLGGKVLGRPSIVVSGGWDVASMPEIAYGAARSPRGRMRARFVLRNADALITFSDWSARKIHALSGRDAQLVYLGVDLERFRPLSKEDVVVTVGRVKRENFARKGLDTFVRAAALLPDVRFVLAGAHEAQDAAALAAIATPNVEFPGWLPDERLRELLGRAKVYLQVSYAEGFGLAVAEAMASGCVPVVTRRGSLPEVAGDAGIYVPYGDPTATATAIREALSSGNGLLARGRVAENFSIGRRRERLLALVKRVAGA